MKKILFSLLVMCFCLYIAGCAKQEKEPEVEEVNKTEEVVKLVNDFTGFNAKTKVTYFNGEEQNTFEMLQEGTVDGKYKIEITAPEGLVGNTTYNDGESIYNANSTRSSQILVSANDYPERVEILASSFIKNYRDKTKEFSKIGETTDGQYIVLEGVIDGSTTYMATEQLIIDINTYKPIKLDIYTSTGDKFVEIEYLEFNYNPQFEEGYFTPIKK